MRFSLPSQLKSHQTIFSRVMELDDNISNEMISQFTNSCSVIAEDLDGNFNTDNMDNCIKELTSSTPIQEFYKNQSIFITGGTGFLGKILIEKLLRSCPKLDQIFVLVREKKGKTVDDRMQDLFEDSVFDSNKCNKINLKKKLYGIAGDCKQKNLGISDNNRQLLKEKVSIVFHVAATVRFNEKLNEAFMTNIQSTSSIVDLCKDMKNLKSFIHVSTLYANCFSTKIEEKFYDYAIDHKELELLVKTLPEVVIDTITPQLMKPWPNTYTFTKSLAEDLIRKTCTDLPVGIFRPAIVTSSAFEPIPGWIDNYNGLAGITASVASGFMRIGFCDTESMLNLVPVDLTVNALIASAWATATQTDRKGDNMLIYNFASVNDAPIAWNKVGQNIVKYINEYPSMIALWCAIFKLTKHKWLYKLYVLFLHLIPAYCIDFAMSTVGQKPRLLAAYQKIHAIVDVLSYFSTKIWQFKDNNVQDMWNRLDARDQQIFQFSMINFDWDNYFSNFIKGVRVFLLKDDLKTLEKSRIKYKRLRLIHQFMMASFVAFICWILFRGILVLL